MQVEMGEIVFVGNSIFSLFLFAPSFYFRVLLFMILVTEDCDVHT